MKRFLNFIFLVLIFSISYSQKITSHFYTLPDSVKAISYFTDISIGPIKTKKEVSVGIGTDVVKLLFESHKNVKEIVFEFSSGSTIVATGVGVEKEKNEITWKYNWSEDENYKLLIATAGDSAGNFALYSGYIFLPKENKWKLIGTCKIVGQWNTLKQPAMISLKPKKTLLIINTREGVWIQRNNGSWKNIHTLPNDFAPPVVNLFSHIDSLKQLEIDKKLITAANTDVKNIDGVYYTILNEGNGRQVSVNDTVTVNYKG